ncbi:MAG TPA: hypothetical protein ENI73_01365 [Spirochaetes bacterium]|nr:hypothetical protein [Spirochaetota bacterium]
MSEDTKELVKALVAGFSTSIREEVKLVRDDFKTEIKLVRDDFKEEIKQTEERLMKAMKAQTTILLKVLKTYEAMTEDHDRTLKKIRDSFDPDKK